MWSINFYTVILSIKFGQSEVSLESLVYLSSIMHQNVMHLFRLSSAWKFDLVAENLNLQKQALDVSDNRQKAAKYARIVYSIS